VFVCVLIIFCSQLLTQSTVWSENALDIIQYLIDTKVSMHIFLCTFYHHHIVTYFSCKAWCLFLAAKFSWNETCDLFVHHWEN